MNNILYTPKTLWQDFDADAPTECRITRNYECGGYEAVEMYFSGRPCEEGRPRIFGKLLKSRPDSKEVVLLVDDRNPVMDFSVYSELSEKYNLFLFDYAGESAETPKHTYYGDHLRYANAAVAGADFERAERSARETPVYEWCAVCRYAVSMVRDLGFEKIGLVGSGEGANLVLMTAATDTRVTCAVSCFGGGWGRYAQNFKYGESPEPEISEEFSRYVAGLEAENYAQSVTAPFLFLSTSNNKRYQIDRINDTIARMGKVLYDFAPRLSGQLDINSGRNILLFLGEHLSGEERETVVPQIKAEVTGGKFRVKLAGAEKFLRAKIYYSANQANPAIRDWREADIAGGECTLTLYEGEERIFLYPRVVLEDGYTLSGRLTVADVSDVRKEAFLPSQVLYTSAMGTDTFTTYVYHSHAIFEEENVRMKKGAFGIEGITDRYNHLATYKVNDERFRFRVDNLNFDLCSARPQTLRVILYECFNTPAERHFAAEVPVLGGEMWQPVTLNVKDFKGEKCALKSFHDVNLLIFKTEDETLFNNILWV